MNFYVEIFKTAKAKLEIAKNFVIDSDAKAQEANDLLRVAKRLAKDIEDEYKHLSKPHMDKVIELREAKKEPMQVLSEVESTLKDALAIYTEKAEAARQAEQSRIDAEMLAQRQAMEKEAALKMLEGHTEEAEAIQLAADLSTVVAAPAPKKLEGLSFRNVWKAEVTDKFALIKFVAENPAYEHLLDVNAVNLRKIATAMQNSMPINGVRFYSEKVTASRA